MRTTITGLEDLWERAISNDLDAWRVMEDATQERGAPAQWMKLATRIYHGLAMANAGFKTGHIDPRLAPAIADRVAATLRELAHPAPVPARSYMMYCWGRLAPQTAEYARSFKQVKCTQLRIYASPPSLDLEMACGAEATRAPAPNRVTNGAEYVVADLALPIIQFHYEPKHPGEPANRRVYDLPAIPGWRAFGDYLEQPRWERDFNF